ncbi:MAG TPA: hypothetical protein VL486_06290 [Verrucomicrobiae bacterium]|nr:hypothetical protein [Verrucomicrobiae bacterium]
MRTTYLAFAAAATALVSVPLQAGVRVSSGEVKEKLVVLRVSEYKYVTASAPGLLDLSGTKIGSKQRFTLIDLNGRNFEDGDDVRIRYTPNKEGKPDPSKASYWREGKEGVTRAHEDGVFTIKRVGTRYAFRAPSGKFVTGTEVGGALAVSAKQDDALLMEVIDLSPDGQPITPAPAKEPPTAPGNSAGE